VILESNDEPQKVKNLFKKALDIYENDLMDDMAEILI
jgi:hypothetical protein